MVATVEMLEVDTPHDMTDPTGSSPVSEDLDSDRRSAGDRPTACHPAAIITGAGSGIGRQTALLLAREGYGLVLVGRTSTKLQKTLELVEADVQDQGQGSKQERATGPAGLHVLAADLVKPAAAHRVVDAAVSTFGRIDAIAHVAGDAPRLPIEQVTPEVWRTCIDVNLSAAVYLAAAAWPVLQHQKKGVFVNVSSMASVDPFPGFAVYAAAKAGLNMFTRCIAAEGHEHGIRAVTVAPGAVETPMLRGLFDTSVIPAEKTLDPADVARVIVDSVTGRRYFEPGEVILLPSPS